MFSCCCAIFMCFITSCSFWRFTVVLWLSLQLNFFLFVCGLLVFIFFMAARFVACLWLRLTIARLFTIIDTFTRLYIRPNRHDGLRFCFRPIKEFNPLLCVVLCCVGRVRVNVAGWLLLKSHPYSVVRFMKKRNRIHEALRAWSVTLSLTLLKSVALAISFSLFFALLSVGPSPVGLWFWRANRCSRNLIQTGRPDAIASLSSSAAPAPGKKSACEGTSCSELAFNGCSESSLFNWLIKVGLDYIACRKHNTEVKFGVFFFMNLGAHASSKQIIRAHICYIQKPYIRSCFFSTTEIMFKSDFRHGSNHSGVLSKTLK